MPSYSATKSARLVFVVRTSSYDNDAAIIRDNFEHMRESTEREGERQRDATLTIRGCVSRDSVDAYISVQDDIRLRPPKEMSQSARRMLFLRDRPF